MITALFAATILLQSGEESTFDIHSRTLITGITDDKRASLAVFERYVAGGRFALITHETDPSGAASYSRSEYMLDGTPIRTTQEGEWSDRWNVFTSEYGKNGGIQDINGARTRFGKSSAFYRNPTSLWFWRTHPRIGQVETVTFLAQNTIADFEIKFTYEGDEVLDVKGRKVQTHRVREDPVGSKGVYTLWWYDDQGMGLKRYHKTTQHEYTYTLTSWK